MFDTEIQMKIEKLPEHAKREVLNFIEFLLSKYSIPRGQQADEIDDDLLLSAQSSIDFWDNPFDDEDWNNVFGTEFLHSSRNISICRRETI